MAVSPSAAADPSSQTSSKDSSSPSQPSQPANKSISEPSSTGQHTLPNGTADEHLNAQDTTSQELKNAPGESADTSGPSPAAGQVPAASDSLPGASNPQRSVPGTSEETSRGSTSGSQKGINTGAKPVTSSSKPSKPSTANGNGNHKAGPSGAPRAQKKSVLDKLLRILIPCAYPDSATHPIDLHTTPSPSAASKEKPPTTPPVDKPAPKEKPNLTLLTSQTVSIPGATESAPKTTAPASKSSATIAPPEEEAVVIPPTPPPQTLPLEETGGVTSGAVQPPGSSVEVSPTAEQKRHSQELTSSPRDEDSEGSSFTEEEEDLHDHELDEQEEEERLIMNGGAGIPIGPDGVPRPLLPPIAPQHAGRKCLVLDLDETLVHSSFKSLQQADYVVPVEIEYQWHNVYVIKRPGVDTFLKKMGELYEVVVFTASLSKYADPVLDKLDIHQVVTHRLFRESCYNHKGNYVKDLSQLGRPIADTIILDNSPASYIFHPNNAVPVSSWFNDPHDTELTDLIPFLADLANVEDVRAVLDGAR